MKDPVVQVLLRQRSEVFREIGRTEVLKDNSNPVFETVIRLDYCFQEVL